MNLRNKNRTAIFGILISLFCLSNLEAFGTRGGGNVVVWFKHGTPKELSPRDEKGNLRNVLIPNSLISEIDRIESFDLFEAKRMLKNIPQGRIIEPLADETPEGYVLRVLGRFSSSYPSLITSFNDALKALPLSRALSSDFGISPENDFTTVGQIDVDQCVLTSQMVQEQIESAYYLNIDERLAKHPGQTRLSYYVNYLHELTYWIKRAQGAKTSDSARKIVSRLIIEAPNDTFASAGEELKNLGLPLDNLWQARLHTIVFGLYDKFIELTESQKIQAIQEFLKLLEDENIYYTDVEGEIEKSINPLSILNPSKYLPSWREKLEKNLVYPRVAANWFHLGNCEKFKHFYKRSTVETTTYDKKGKKKLSWNEAYDPVSSEIQEKIAELTSKISSYTNLTFLNPDDWMDIREELKLFYNEKYQPLLAATPGFSDAQILEWTQFFLSEIETGMPGVDLVTVGEFERTFENTYSYWETLDYMTSAVKSVRYFTQETMKNLKIDPSSQIGKGYKLVEFPSARLDKILPSMGVNEVKK